MPIVEDTLHFKKKSQFLDIRREKALLRKNYYLYIRKLTLTVLEGHLFWVVEKKSSSYLERKLVAAFCTKTLDTETHHPLDRRHRKTPYHQCVLITKKYGSTV